MRSGGSIGSILSANDDRAVEARVIIAKSGHIERTDRIISTAVKGRKATLHEIDRRRQIFVQALSDKIDEVTRDADIAA